MEKNKMKELLIDHKEKFLSKKYLIKREIQKQIKTYLKQKEIILITGVRRGGKSSLMKLICDDIIAGNPAVIPNILYLNFEDERLTEFTVSDFEALHEVFLEIENPKGRKYFFLDEIQNIKGWEKWLNRLYEFEDIKIFVTGSNSSILSSDVSTALTGRNRQIINWTFSFREFLAFRKCEINNQKDIYVRSKKAEIKRLFSEYLKFGGFPEVLKIRDVSLLEQYFKDIIYRDVIARHSIKNIKEIKELALFLASNLGTIQSYKNAQDMIDVKSINTVKNYIEVLEDVFLFFSMDMFDYSIKRQIYNPSKIYCIDTALSDSISFKFSRNIGHCLENIVFIELLRRRKDIYYWKSKKRREVDFVIKEGMKLKEVIQVSASLSNEKTRKREIQSLLDAKEELRPKTLTIITEDYEEEIVMGRKKIAVIPIWKWLLEG